MGVAQLVERCVVVADVAGSSPVTHPVLWRDRTRSPVAPPVVTPGAPDPLVPFIRSGNGQRGPTRGISDALLGMRNGIACVLILIWAPLTVLTRRHSVSSTPSRLFTSAKSLWCSTSVSAIASTFSRPPCAPMLWCSPTSWIKRPGPAMEGNHAVSVARQASSTKATRWSDPALLSADPRALPGEAT